MLNFDFAQLPADMMQLLMCRGSGDPPLQWHEHQNTLAKRKLDEIEDARLFGSAGTRNEAVQATIRALLFLWTGWTDEANMLAQIAPAKERLYITALCARHRGKADMAKAAFKKMEGHSIFKPLAEQVLKVIRPDAEPSLKRFRDIAEQNKEWEPYAFIDLYEQARTGRLSQVAWQVVGQLQTNEFEFLFNHCFVALTGRSVFKRRVISEADEQRREQDYRRRMAERRKEAEKRSQRQMKEHQPPSKKETSEPTKPQRSPDPRAKILCPKCGQLLYLPESSRGRPAKCLKCSVVFLVPPKKPETQARGLAAKK